MNKTVSFRDQVLKPYFCDNERLGGLRYFRGLPATELRKLLENDLVEPGAWNSCDGVEKLFLPFLRRNPNFTAHGYVGYGKGQIGPQLTVEGLERLGDFTKAELADFARTFAGADELMIDDDTRCPQLYCWYD